MFLRTKLSVFTGCVRNVVYQMILKINPKCLPVTYYPRYGLTHFLSICIRKKHPFALFSSISNPCPMLPVLLGPHPRNIFIFP